MRQTTMFVVLAMITGAFMLFAAASVFLSPG